MGSEWVYDEHVHNVAFWEPVELSGGKSSLRYAENSRTSRIKEPLSGVKGVGHSFGYRHPH